MRSCLLAVTAIVLVAVTACGAESSDGPVGSTARAEVGSATDDNTTAPAEPEATTPEPAGTAVGPAATDLDWQGHRGARGLRPENTLPGFELALDLGVDTLELDLHYSADGVVVVWHDPVIEAGKCQGEGVASPVRQLTAAELRALRCDANPDPGRFPDQRPDPGQLAGDDYGIVSLAELLAFVAGYAGSDDKSPAQRASADEVRFNIETKRRPDEPATIDDGFDGSTVGPFEIAVLAAIGDAGVEARTTIQSFDHRSLWAIRAENRSVTLAALTTRRDQPDLADLADRGADIWSPDHRAVTEASVAEARSVGLLVVPWTVNEANDLSRLVDLGVDGIITDRPDRRPSES